MELVLIYGAAAAGVSYLVMSARVTKSPRWWALRKLDKKRAGGSKFATELIYWWGCFDCNPFATSVVVWAVAGRHGTPWRILPFAVLGSWVAARALMKLIGWSTVRELQLPNGAIIEKGGRDFPPEVLHELPEPGRAGA